MRRNRRGLTVVLLVAALVVSAVGCKSSSPSKKDEPLTDTGSKVPAFFEEIPAETFYVYSGLEPVPKAVVESTLEQYGDSLATFLGRAAKGMGSGSLPAALHDEIDGELDPERWQELGFSLEPRFALYGVGAVPIFRMELGDTEAFERMLGRIESKAEVDVRIKESKGEQYRLYGSEEVHVPVVVRDGAVVVSLYDPELEDVLLPYVLGRAKPDRSLADARHLRNLVRRYDYEEYLLGYHDLRGMIRAFTGVDTPREATESVMQATEISLASPSEACRSEIAQVADVAPRLVFGTTEFTAERVRTELGLELQEKYAEELAATVGPVPALDSSLFERSMLAVAMGLDMERVIGMLRTHARSIADEPYECEDLAPINRMARRFRNRPLPTVLTQLRGAALMLDGLAFGEGFIPTELNAVAMARMDNPKALIGRLQPLITGMMQVEIEDDGVPVPLEKLDRQSSVIESPHVAQRDKTLAFSVGVGMQDEMATLLEQPLAEPSQTAFAVRYDLEKLSEAIPEQFGNGIGTLLDESMVASLLEGSMEMRVAFRERGVFVTTDQRRSSDSREESSSRRNSGASVESVGANLRERRAK